MYVHFGTADVEGSRFENNQAVYYGDDICSSSATITCPVTCPVTYPSGSCSEVACSSCTCYSCECDTFLPTSSPFPSLAPTWSPTPLPSALPTPTPSTPPTPAPSQIPTPAPTPTTVVTIAPEIDVLSLTATKPANASNLETNVLYLVNLNEETLRGTTGLLRTSLPDREAWSISPSTFAIAPGEFQPLIASIQSTGLEPRSYDDNAILFTAWTDNSLPVNRSLDVSVTIRSSIDRDQTLVDIQGRPTLNKPWEGITIFPFDSEGRRMNTEPEGNFDIALNFGNQSTTCDVRWTDALYNTSCVVPGTSRAGDWGLSALFDGVEFFTTDVHVQCAKGYFEKPDDTCETCPRGTECLAGSTLLNLPVVPGFWRSGEAMPSYSGDRSETLTVFSPLQHRTDLN